MTEAKSIHTLNARGNILLEVTRDQFNLQPDRMLTEIQALRQMVERALALKGLKYESLKTALVPDRKRSEIALVFDTVKIESNSYGYKVFENLIPLFDKTSNHSVLVTDYSDRGAGQDTMQAAMAEAVKLRRDVNWKHSSQFYIVYINNLTQTMIERIDGGLTTWDAYVGYADTTYASRFKLLISTMAVNLCVKVGKVILQGYEDDVPNEEDSNMCGYPFEANGYTCRSIQSILEGTLLSYKIERPVIKGFEVDTEMSLNAVSSMPLSLDDFTVEVDEAKLGYLITAKSGSLTKAGLQAIDSRKLAQLIKERIALNYIYNMSFDSVHNTTKFNIILEIPPVAHSSKPTRLLASLEYQPACKNLRLITFY